MNHNKNKIIIIGSVIIFFIALSLIGIGTYLEHLTNPTIIFSSAIDKANKSIKNILFDPNQDILNSDTFSLTSNIKFNFRESNFSSETTGYDYQKFFQNLNLTNTTISLNQDKKSKQALFSINSTLNNEPLYNTKYLIDDSTEYLLIPNAYPQYINRGSSNYFESLEKEQTTKNNINYLYDFIITSLKNNLKDEYFEKSKQETSVIDKNENLTKITLKLDNSIIKEILSNILNDLKQDTTANKILTSYDENFQKTKIKDDIIFLDEDEDITINIFINSLTTEVRKLEYIYNVGSVEKDQTKIVYEHNNTKSIISSIQNNKIINTFNIIKSKDNTLNIEIFDSKNNSIGTLEYEKTDTATYINIYSTTKAQRIELNYSAKLENQTSSSFEKNSKLTLKYTKKNTNIIDIDIIVNSLYNKIASIKEDTTSAVLAATLTDEDQLRITNSLDDVINKLFGNY